MYDIIMEVFAMQDSNEKLFAALSYFWILWIIPAVAGSSFSKYHANQGLMLFIVETVLGVITGILFFIIGKIPFIGGLITGILGGVIGLIFLLGAIVGIVHAVNGETKPLPGLGDISIIK